MGDHFCNAVGVLQQFAPPGQFAGFDKTGSKPPAVTNDGKDGNVCKVTTEAVFFEQL